MADVTQDQEAREEAPTAGGEAEAEICPLEGGAGWRLTICWPSGERESHDIPGAGDEYIGTIVEAINARRPAPSRPEDRGDWSADGQRHIHNRLEELLVRYGDAREREQKNGPESQAAWQTFMLELKAHCDRRAVVQPPPREPAAEGEEEHCGCEGFTTCRWCSHPLKAHGYRWCAMCYEELRLRRPRWKANAPLADHPFGCPHEPLIQQRARPSSPTGETACSCLCHEGRRRTTCLHCKPVEDDPCPYIHDSGDRCVLQFGHGHVHDLGYADKPVPTGETPCATCGKTEEGNPEHTLWLPFDERPKGHQYAPTGETAGQGVEEAWVRIADAEPGSVWPHGASVWKRPYHDRVFIPKDLEQTIRAEEREARATAAEAERDRLREALERWARAYGRWDDTVTLWTCGICEEDGGHADGCPVALVPALAGESPGAGEGE